MKIREIFVTTAYMQYQDIHKLIYIQQSIRMEHYEKQTVNTTEH